MWDSKSALAHRNSWRAYSSRNISPIRADHCKYTTFLGQPAEVRGVGEATSHKEALLFPCPLNLQLISFIYPVDQL
jgi:hypothetical protein